MSTGLIISRNYREMLLKPEFSEIWTLYHYPSSAPGKELHSFLVLKKPAQISLPPPPPDYRTSLPPNSVAENAITSSKPWVLIHLSPDPAGSPGPTTRTVHNVSYLCTQLLVRSFISPSYSWLQEDQRRKIFAKTLSLFCVPEVPARRWLLSRNR